MAREHTALIISTRIMAFATLAVSLLGLPLSSYALSQSGNYTPTFYECPSGQTFVRNASQSLSSEEAAWLQKRRPNVVQALQTYLNTVGIQGLNISEYISAVNGTGSAVPTIGLTWSGGGTRSESSDYGQMRAFDGRVAAAVDARTGGLLQATTYVAGLSGGATGLGPVAIADFQNIEVMLQQGLLSTKVNQSAFAEIAGKAEQGFDVTVADIFGIDLNYYAMKDPSNNSVNPLSRLWSDITAFSNFSTGLSPMAIIMYNEVIPKGLPGHNSFEGILIPADNARLEGTIYEASPFEFGSWQGRGSAFVKTQFLGTNFSNSQPVNNTCVQGFDSAAFMVGSADSAINYWYAQSKSNGTVGQFAKRNSDGANSSMSSKMPYPPNEDQLEQMKLEKATTAEVDALPEYAQLLGNQTVDQILYASWPNPFIDSNYTDKNLRSQDSLYLVDGSEYGQENPIVPLIQPARTPDFIVVNDACGSELSSGWQNGTNFINTADWAKKQGLPFPKVPTVNTMLNLNHTLFPTFYGCFEENVPLVLFAADAPYTEYSNLTSVATIEYSDEQHEKLWNNTLAIYSQPQNLQPNVTSDFPTCIACGAIYRSLQRLNMSIPDVCNTCFQDHCWNGTVDNSQPGFLAPPLLYSPQTTFEQWNTSFYNNSQ
ncbi:FabD/lysophospholipase-like protein [Irpex rosettiformis]|uniref:FabD/lysophospholipase-like protein n=1 Tax=Irpex rosettiformis TaxID=378272 RepID=A0ACB8UH74_9APHY|nr:FabD/lysophospholipase-like protein [Irpex rosettiformis]